MTTALVATCAAVASVACGSPHGMPAAHTSADPYRGAILGSAVPRPDFTLTDTSGAPFDFGTKTRDRVTLLYFGYTNCPDVCPTHMSNIAAALRQLPADVASKIDVVFVTTDPNRDTPAVLRTWLDHFDPRFVGLVGTADAIAAAERLAGVPPSAPEPAANGQYGVSHAAYVIAFTRDNLAHLVYPGGVTAPDWEHDLPLLVNSGWVG